MIIWGDDIGFWNISAYNTGRAAFITGQSVFRTGLSKVGMPGADPGIRPEDPTIPELLKPLGYATVNFSATRIT